MSLLDHKSVGVAKLVQARNAAFDKSEEGQRKKAERAKRWQDESVAEADHAGEPWTERDIRIAFSNRWTLREIACILGRSIKAVQGARQTYAWMAPDDFQHAGCQKIDLNADA